MTTKGFTHSLATRRKIGIANQKDRAKINKSIEEYINRLAKKDFPSVTDASIYAGINEKNLINYEIQTPDNSDIRLLLDTIRDLQKSALITKGLTKKYDTRITTLLLKAHHGIKEEPTSLTQTNIFNVSPELMAEAITLSRKKTPAK